MALTKCKECNGDVSTKAACCPKCGAKVPSRFGVGTFLVCLVVLYLIYSIYIASQKVYATQRENRALNAGVSNEQIYQTTARQLFVDYEKNEVAADEKIKGKVVEVTGVVQSINKDFTDAIIISLVTPNQFETANLRVDDSQKQIALELTRGAEVTLDCLHMKRWAGSPSGEECKFKPQAAQQPATPRPYP